MSVLSGKVEEYDNVSYDGFEENELPSSVYIPFQKEKDLSASNNVTEITPEIPTITLDDDYQEIENQDEDDIAITNVISKISSELVTTANMSDINQGIQNSFNQINDINHNENIFKNSSIHTIKNDKDSITNNNEFKLACGDGDSINHLNAKLNINIPETLNNSNKITSISPLIGGLKKTKEVVNQAVDSDSEYRLMINKKCQELIQQRCWRKRKRKRRKIKRMQERESGIIVISSDENDSGDQFEYTSSSDDIDSKQPPCKLARVNKKSGNSELVTPKTNLTSTISNSPSVSTLAITDTIINNQSNLADNNNDLLKSPLNDSDSVSSTDLSSEECLSHHENEDKKRLLKVNSDINYEHNVCDDVKSVCNGDGAGEHNDTKGDTKHIQEKDKSCLDNI